MAIHVVYNRDGSAYGELDTNNYIFNNSAIGVNPVKLDPQIYPYVKIDGVYYVNDGEEWVALSRSNNSASLMPSVNLYLVQNDNFLQKASNFKLVNGNIQSTTTYDTTIKGYWSMSCIGLYGIDSKRPSFETYRSTESWSNLGYVFDDVQYYGRSSGKTTKNWSFSDKQVNELIFSTFGKHTGEKFKIKIEKGMLLLEYKSNIYKYVLNNGAIVKLYRRLPSEPQRPSYNYKTDEKENYYYSHIPYNESFTALTQTPWVNVDKFEDLGHIDASLYFIPGEITGYAGSWDPSPRYDSVVTIIECNIPQYKNLSIGEYVIDPNIEYSLDNWEEVESYITTTDDYSLGSLMGGSPDTELEFESYDGSSKPSKPWKMDRVEQIVSFGIHARCGIPLGENYSTYYWEDASGKYHASRRLRGVLTITNKLPKFYSNWSDIQKVVSYDDFIYNRKATVSNRKATLLLEMIRKFSLSPGISKIEGWDLTKATNENAYFKPEIKDKSNIFWKGHLDFSWMTNDYSMYYYGGIGYVRESSDINPTAYALTIEYPNVEDWYYEGAITI